MSQTLEPYKLAVDIFRRAISSTTSAEVTTWPESSMPRSQPVNVIADGLGSTYTRDIWFTHFKSYLAEQRVTKTAVGFSYREPGLPYRGIDTDVEIDSPDSEVKCRPYLPSPEQEIAYFCFSFAAPLWTIELAKWTRDPSSSGSLQNLKGVVLVQPALEVAYLFVNEFLQTPGAVPLIIQQLKDPIIVEDLATKFLAAVEELAQKKVPIHLLYWPYDTITLFPNRFFRRLGSFGVQIHDAVDLDDLLKKKPRHIDLRHLFVPSQKPMLEAAAQWCI